MAEPVNYEGKSRSEYGRMHSGWSKKTTRLAWHIDRYLEEHISDAMKKVLAQGTSTLAQTLRNVASGAMEQASKKLRVEVKTT